MTKRVAILYGGLSTERDVSLRSGQAVYNALQKKDFDIALVDVDRNLVEKLKKHRPDVAVIALHGKYGEDGCVQGLLELLDIPYTGPGVMASAVAMNKNMTKKLLSYEGIPTPGFMILDGRSADVPVLSSHILNTLKPPLVIKAANQGSSIGISFAFTDEEVAEGLTECLKYDYEILVEQFIKGRELTVSVLGNDEPVALPILEIKAESGVYDYHAKYTVGASAHYPVELPADLDRQIKELALKTYRCVGCRGLSRVDFLLPENNEPYVLEINTSPGMTATSLFPDAAKAAGISFPDLVEKLVELAFEAHSDK